MKKFFKDPWTIGIGTSVLGVLLLRLIDWLTGNSTVLSIPFNYVIGLFSKLVNAVTSSYFVEFYGLIIIFFSGLIIGLLVGVLKKTRTIGQDDNRIPNSKLNELLSYVKDVFGGVQYRWTFQKNYEGKYIIENIRAHCTKCDCALIREECPNCGTTYYNRTKDDHEISTLIMHRLEKKQS